MQRPICTSPATPHLSLAWLCCADLPLFCCGVCLLHSGTEEVSSVQWALLSAPTVLCSDARWPSTAGSRYPHQQPSPAAAQRTPTAAPAGKQWGWRGQQPAAPALAGSVQSPMAAQVNANQQPLQQHAALAQPAAGSCSRGMGAHTGGMSPAAWRHANLHRGRRTDCQQQHFQRGQCCPWSPHEPSVSRFNVLLAFPSALCRALIPCGPPTMCETLALLLVVLVCMCAGC